MKVLPDKSHGLTITNDLFADKLKKRCYGVYGAQLGGIPFTRGCDWQEVCHI